MNIFQPTSILLPQNTSYEKWSVVACDQFSAEPRYWNRVRQNTFGFHSSMHMILPDTELGNPRLPSSIGWINETMERYLQDSVFRQFDQAYIYVERTLENGMVRAGLLGAIDLEAYDYRDNSLSLLRPSEKILEEQFPPRVQLRRNAKLEFAHTRILCDDADCSLIEPFSDIKDRLPILYDFDLMEHGGHLAGWLVQGEAAADFNRRLTHYADHFREKYPDIDGSPMLFTAGEGNLTLAAAKRCYEEQKRLHPHQDFSRDPCRFTLVELENLYSPALQLKRIHRVVTGTNAKALLNRLQTYTAPNGYPILWCIGSERGVLYLDRDRGSRAICVLQNFLDDYLGEHPGTMEYISGRRNVEEMSLQKNAVGFILPDIAREKLFPELIQGGIFPRKSFDLCRPNEMRYYLEGRIIR